MRQDDRSDTKENIRDMIDEDPSERKERLRQAQQQIMQTKKTYRREMSMLKHGKDVQKL